ncbi:MAG: hypothetical protein QME50_07295 [Candidatus Bathyarchaeota archaeon]|nr:hypothetical protein [Candidatus Bathyarchaeota archaeon]
MKAKQKFCGNCGNHNVYEYPEKIFCSKRFSKNEDPIVETLWCCPEWNPSSQECYCVEEALNKQNKNNLHLSLIYH